MDKKNLDQSQEQTHMTRRALRFIFNLPIKKIGSVIYIVTQLPVMVAYESYCSGSCEPGSRCRPNEMYVWIWETLGGRDFGMRGIWVRGGKWGDQFTSNLGTRWTGSYHSKEGSK